jgi:tetratricopeptide (TPR) repeat protein
MMRYRVQPAPMPQIAAELGADYVVEGTVRREAERVRVTLQLIDARDDCHLWAQSYERTLTSALTLQSEIAGDVASRLATRFVGESAAPPTSNSEAYDLFLRARLLGQQVTAVSPREQWTEVTALISSAIEIDPDFASAYAFRAGYQTTMFAFNYDNSDELVRRINADLAAARRLAPRDPLALAAAAGNHLWIEVDLERALSAYQEADAAGLDDAMTLSSYAMVMERLGRDDEVHDLICRAIALDPANPFLIATSAVIFSILGRLAEAMTLIDRGIKIYPERRFLRLVRAQLIFVNIGHIEELLCELDVSTRQLPQASLIDLNFRTLLCAGAYDELQRLLDAIPESEIRMIPGLGGGGAMFGVGNRPMAQFRGWIALLRGDVAEAARQGAAVLDFCARSKPTRANSGFHRSLSVEGHLFMGQYDRAIAAARATVSSINPEHDPFGRFSVFYAARCLAWIGAHDEAVSLLESQSSRNLNRISAFCCRDPTLTTPLAGNARFATLTARLEAGLAERASQLSGIIFGRSGERTV